MDSKLRIKSINLTKMESLGGRFVKRHLKKDKKSRSD